MRLRMNSAATPKTPYTSTSLWQSQEATANQIETMKPDAVALLGDLQYQVGQYSDFEQSFDLTYGAFKFLHRPSPGNHEFYDEHGETGVAGYGYFSYYNGFQINANGNVRFRRLRSRTRAHQLLSAACSYRALPLPTPNPCRERMDRRGTSRKRADLRPRRRTNRSRRWLVLLQSGLVAPYFAQYRVLDTAGRLFAHGRLVCRRTRMAEKGSRGESFRVHSRLLAPAHVQRCQQPHPEGTTAQAFWQLLYEHNADLVLNGHDHLYARYRPLDPSGNYDPSRGIREFIVGTGGETLDPVVTTTATSGRDEILPATRTFNAENLEAATGDYWGVMALTLDPNGYKWDFESALEGPVNNGQLPSASPTGTYSDKGVGFCHGSDNR